MSGGREGLKPQTGPGIGLCPQCRIQFFNTTKGRTRVYCTKECAKKAQYAGNKKPRKDEDESALPL